MARNDDIVVYTIIIGRYSLDLHSLTHAREILVVRNCGDSELSLKMINRVSKGLSFGAHSLFRMYREGGND